MLNTYMGFSAGAGPEEGAMLIFAHTAREARKVGYRYWWDYEYIDFAVRRMRGRDWLYDEANQEKLIQDIPHAIDNPKSCKHCETWGGSPIRDDGLCQECADYMARYVEGEVAAIER